MSMEEPKQPPQQSTYRLRSLQPWLLAVVTLSILGFGGAATAMFIGGNFGTTSSPDVERGFIGHW